MNLPAPCNGGEIYLAAILKELELIRAELAPKVINVTDVANGNETELRETAPSPSNKRRK